MSKKEFIAEYLDEFWGMVADAAVMQRQGAELSLSLRSKLQKVEKLLGEAYDSLQPKESQRPTIALNGHKAAK